MEKNAGWNIVRIIGKYFNQLVQEHIAASPFFGLMVDETTDISTTTQLIGTGSPSPHTPRALALGPRGPVRDDILRPAPRALIGQIWTTKFKFGLRPSASPNTIGQSPH